MKMGVFRVGKVGCRWRVVGVWPKKSCDWERGGSGDVRVVRVGGSGGIGRGSVVSAEFVSGGDRQLWRTDKTLLIRSENTPYCTVSGKIIYSTSPFSTR